MKPLAITLTGAALLASTATTALPYYHSPVPGPNPNYQTYLRGKIAPTPGPFPESLNNAAWLRKLQRSVANATRHSIDPFWRCVPRQIAIPDGNVLCVRFSTASWNPRYAVRLFEDGSWTAWRV
jgi:hypothetical protein